MPQSEEAAAFLWEEFPELRDSFGSRYGIFSFGLQNMPCRSFIQICSVLSAGSEAAPGFCVFRRVQERKKSRGDL